MITALASLAIFPERLPWRTMADEMKAAGVSYNRQAQTIGIEWSTYQRLLEGTEPKHSIGEAIRTMHRTVCGSLDAKALCKAIPAA